MGLVCSDHPVKNLVSLAVRHFSKHTDSNRSIPTHWFDGRDAGRDSS
jgi:hypothetical protein